MASIGAKLKSMAASASKGVSQYMSAPQDAESSRSAGANKFSNVKRRMTESVMSSMGKAEITEDSEYDSRKAIFFGTEKHLQNLRKSLVSYLEGLRVMTFASSEAGTAMREIFTGTLPPYSSQVENFASGLNSLDGGMRSTLDERYMADVIEPLDGILKRGASLHEIMRGRELVKVDFDARLRKLKLLKQSGPTGDPTKIPKKEAKLQHTAQSLDTATMDIYREMDALERERVATVTMVLQRFAAIQRQFFTTGTGVVTSLPDLPATMTIRHPSLPPDLREPVYKQFIHGVNLPTPTATTTTTTQSTVVTESVYPATTAPAPYKNSSPYPSTTMAPASVYPATSTITTSSRPLPTAIPVPPRAAAPSMMTAVVQFPYKALQPDEVSLEAGESVTVLEKHEDGWAKVTSSKGKTGFFPANYLS